MYVAFDSWADEAVGNTNVLDIDPRK